MVYIVGDLSFAWLTSPNIVFLAVYHSAEMAKITVVPKKPRKLDVKGDRLMKLLSNVGKLYRFVTVLYPEKSTRKSLKLYERIPLLFVKLQCKLYIT
jgi:hypothetical protein